MPQEKVLIYENQKKGKYEIRFKENFDYGVLFSKSIETGYCAVMYMAWEINNLHDDVEYKIIRRMVELKRGKEVDGIVPVKDAIFPRIVFKKEDFNG